MIDKLVERNGQKAKTWFTSRNDDKIGKFYDVDIIKIDFKKWIDEGMND